MEPLLYTDSAKVKIGAGPAVVIGEKINPTGREKLGTALAGLGGAVLTFVQLRMFREGIMGGRGWIAVALVIFRALAAEPRAAGCAAVRPGGFDPIPHPGVEPDRPRHGHDPL